MKENINALKNRFKALYPSAGEPRVFGGPGRINVIGGHTDYNLGFVLPCAVDREILVAASVRQDDILSLYSVDYKQPFEIKLGSLKFSENQKWANYLMGVFSVLLEDGFHLNGMNMVFGGNIPQGGGMSSSAALEVAVCTAIRAMQGVKLSDIELVKYCQKAENKFVGVMCGIMDQFASAMSKKGHLLFLDCADLSYELIPMKFEDISFFIADTKKERTLAGSEYNLRRQQCTQAAEIFRKLDPKVRGLRDVSIEVFEKNKGKVPLPARKRAEHVIYEIDRVKKAAEALKSNDLEAIGRIQRESFRSMRDIFEISCPEINAMADISDSVEGVYGTRIIGGGFGGCTISIVRNSAIKELEDKLAQEYPKRTGLTPEFWVVNSADGAGEVF